MEKSAIPELSYSDDVQKAIVRLLFKNLKSPAKKPDISIKVLDILVTKCEHHTLSYSDITRVVTYVTAFPKRKATANLTYIDISSNIGGASHRPDLHKLPLVPLSIPQILRQGVEISEHTLQHDAVRGIMMDPAVTFDLVLVHWFYSTLLVPLGSLFNCPLVWYAAGDACWASLQLVHELPSPAYSVGPHSHHLPSIPFTINDRITQLWQQLYFGFWTRYYFDYVEPPIYEATYAAAMRVRGLVPPPYDLVAKNGSLLLLNSHPPLGQSLPLPLNAKLVGGHHLRPLKPLPEKFQIFMDNAKHGLIFMELGAGVESSDMPQHVRKRLLDMFGELQHQVVWRLDERPPHAARNVHVLERAPALEMLCHPNTLMVITDGSTTSLMEALHCGVPVVTVPFLGDQFLNADLAVAQGFAIKVEFTHHFAWKLREAIGEILGNNSLLTLLYINDDCILYWCLAKAVLVIGLMSTYFFLLLRSSVLFTSHYQPINVPIAGAQAFLIDGIGRLGHDPPRAQCGLVGANDYRCSRYQWLNVPSEEPGSLRY
ncbi:hypothetical protein evm_013066 [Chilo suppressalis]|nr:hypothetical protein evm_013066 [Chilo suppressalis]